MHRLAILVLLVACGKKDESAPKPTDNKPDKPAETKLDDKTPPGPTKPCTVDVKIDGDAVKFSVGATAGSTSAAAVDFSPLKSSAGCSANIQASDTTGYKTVIAVMDKLVATGIINVALDDGTGGKAAPPKAPPKGPSLEDMGWRVEIKPDGTIVGTRDPAKATPVTERLAKTPVIILAKDKASIRAGGETKEIGESTANDLDLEVQKALPDRPADPTVIIQADQDLAYAAIKKAVFGAKAAGYDNVLFAVKNR